MEAIFTALLGLLLLVGMVAIPIVLIQKTVRWFGSLVGSGARPRGDASYRSRKKVLCFDCKTYSVVVGKPLLDGPPDHIGQPPWRVPINLPIPPALREFLDEHEEWIAGLDRKHMLLFGDDGPNWREFTEFLNRQLEREGVKTGGILKRPLRVTETLARQVVYRHHLGSLWETHEAWMDCFMQGRGESWPDEIAAAIVADFPEGWGSLLPYIEWYGITRNVYVPIKRIRKLAQHLHREQADQRWSQDLAAHAEGIAVTIEDVDHMDPYAFESFLGEVFASLGYSVTATPASGDQGADVLIEKSGERTVVQAKLYSQPVGNKAVQEAIAAREYFRCQRAQVVTNNSFTRSALDLASSTGVHLVDRAALIDLLEGYNAARV